MNKNAGVHIYNVDIIHVVSYQSNPPSTISASRAPVTSVNIGTNCSTFAIVTPP